MLPPCFDVDIVVRSTGGRRLFLSPFNVSIKSKVVMYLGTYSRVIRYTQYCTRQVLYLFPLCRALYCMLQYRQ